MTEVESRINESGSMNISEGVAYLISRERVSSASAKWKMSNDPIRTLSLLLPSGDPGPLRQGAGSTRRPPLCGKDVPTGPHRVA
jgi:hypothetical protein